MAASTSFTHLPTPPVGDHEPLLSAPPSDESERSRPVKRVREGGPVLSSLEASEKDVDSIESLMLRMERYTISDLSSCIPHLAESELHSILTTAGGKADELFRKIITVASLERFRFIVANAPAERLVAIYPQLSIEQRLELYKSMKEAIAPAIVAKMSFSDLSAWAASLLSTPEASAPNLDLIVGLLKLSQILHLTTRVDSEFLYRIVPRLPVAMLYRVFEAFPTENIHQFLIQIRRAFQAMTVAQKKEVAEQTSGNLPNLFHLDIVVGLGQPTFDELFFSRMNEMPPSRMLVGWTVANGETLLKMMHAVKVDRLVSVFPSLLSPWGSMVYYEYRENIEVLGKLLASTPVEKIIECLDSLPYESFKALLPKMSDQQFFILNTLKRDPYYNLQNKEILDHRERVLLDALALPYLSEISFEARLKELSETFPIYERIHAAGREIFILALQQASIRSLLLREVEKFSPDELECVASILSLDDLAEIMGGLNEVRCKTIAAKMASRLPLSEKTDGALEEISQRFNSLLSRIHLDAWIERAVLLRKEMESLKGLEATSAEELEKRGQELIVDLSTLKRQVAEWRGESCKLRGKTLFFREAIHYCSTPQLTEKMGVLIERGAALVGKFEELTKLLSDG